MNIDVDSFKDNVYKLMYNTFKNDKDQINKAKDMTDRILAFLALSIKIPNNT